MTVRIETKLEGKAAEYLARLQARLGEKSRKTLDGAAAKSVAALVTRHLARLGNERHATAQKFGAKPTNIIKRKAEEVSVRQDAGGTFVVVPHPLFRRAFRDVEIAPRTAKALAIPVAGEAYDKAPRSFAELFVWKRKKGAEGKDDKGAAFLARKKGDALQLLYLLRQGRIKQTQDPTLLPEAEEQAKAARSGLSALIRRIAAQGKGGAA